MTTQTLNVAELSHPSFILDDYRPGVETAYDESVRAHQRSMLNYITNMVLGEAGASPEQIKVGRAGDERTEGRAQ